MQIDSVCNGCHDLKMLCLNISSVAIITVEGVNYRCFTDGSHLVVNYVLDDRGYI